MRHETSRLKEMNGHTLENAQREIAQLAPGPSINGSCLSFLLGCFSRKILGSKHAPSPGGIAWRTSQHILQVLRPRDIPVPRALPMCSQDTQSFSDVFGRTHLRHGLTFYVGSRCEPCSPDPFETGSFRLTELSPPALNPFPISILAKLLKQGLRILILNGKRAQWRCSAFLNFSQ